MPSTQPQLGDFSAYIEAAMTTWSCPGAAVAIIQGDTILHQGTYGLRDVENNLPLTAETRFAMASVTKSFTAMSVALLVDQGKLEWDKPVREYIPEFILDDPYVTQHLTVRDMLSHRSGLPRHDMAAWRSKLSRTEFIKRMRHLKFSASFRQYFQYNNLMYYATAYLVERVSGQRWEEFVQNCIFAPLNMTSSNFGPEPLQPDHITALGYRVDRDTEGNAQGLIRMPYGEYTELSPGAAGGIFSNLADLTQWLKVHINQGKVDHVKLVTDNTLKQMHLPQMVVPTGSVGEALMGNTISAYGMGWSIEPYKGHTLIRHGGNVEGFSVIIGFVPQQNIGVIGLTNIQGLPLRDVILYEGIDRALALPSQDWNSKFHKLVDVSLKAGARGKQTSTDERIDNAPPTHPLDAYVGTFAFDGYPDFAVQLQGDQLQASLVESLEWSTLRHYHYNVFEWHMADFDEWVKLSFLVNEGGEITRVSIGLEGSVINSLFVRKPIDLPADVGLTVVGTYTTDIDGLEFMVEAREGKFYLTETGSPAAEITPYKFNAESVGFRINRARLDFNIENECVVQLQVKGPGFTLNAVPEKKN